MKSLFAVLCLGTTLLSCGAQIDKAKVGAYFSGLAQGGLQQASLEAYAQLFCEDVTKAKITGKEEEQTLTLTNCERNGIKANGELKQVVVQGEKFSLSGKLDFEVLDPKANGFTNCRDVLSKGDKASCSIDISATKDKPKPEAKLCGLSQDDFDAAVKNACGKDDAKK